MKQIYLIKYRIQSCILIRLNRVMEWIKQKHMWILEACRTNCLYLNRERKKKRKKRSERTKTSGVLILFVPCYGSKRGCTVPSQFRYEKRKEKKGKSWLTNTYFFYRWKTYNMLYLPIKPISEMFVCLLITVFALNTVDALIYTTL